MPAHLIEHAVRQPNLELVLPVNGEDVTNREPAAGAEGEALEVTVLVRIGRRPIHDGDRRDRRAAKG